MSSSETSLKRLQLVFGLMIMVGPAIGVVFDLALVGIAIGVTGLVVSLALLFIIQAQTRGG